MVYCRLVLTLQQISTEIYKEGLSTATNDPLARGRRKRRITSRGELECLRTTHQSELMRECLQDGVGDDNVILRNITMEKKILVLIRKVNPLGD